MAASPSSTLRSELEKSSTMTGMKPASCSSTTVWELMNAAPPVTMIFSMFVGLAVIESNNRPGSPLQGPVYHLPDLAAVRALDVHQHGLRGGNGPEIRFV